MGRPIVIARAYGGEPICRVAVRSGNGLVYLANPAYIGEVDSGASWPVGFPAEDVFTYEDQIFKAMISRWRQMGETNQGDWLALKPFADPFG
jgi:hypothetical protein